MGGTAGRYVYLFKTLSKLPLKPDSPVQLRVGSSTLPVSVLRSERDSLELALSTDLGSNIPEAQALFEAADVLGAVSARLAALQNDSAGFNSALAEKVFNLASLSSEQRFEPLLPTDTLTDEQRYVAQGLSSLEAGFLWGPPGTGKTATLSALVHAAFTENRRTLIVSHTNNAVDALLSALCRRVSGRAKLAIPEGSIIRLGPISQPQLAEEFGAQIGLESVLARAQEKTASRLDGLRAELRKIREKIASLESSAALVRSEISLKSKLGMLKARRSATSPGLFGTLRRVFFGWGKVRQVVVDETVDLDGEIKLVEGALKKIGATLGDAHRERVSADIEDARAEEPEIAAAVARLEDVLREVRRGSLDRARVVAATATRAILMPEQLSGFDLVIIDEASMLPMPLVYLLTGLSRAQAVIAGDFRQLPPIALSHDPLVKEWFARDIFEAAGVVSLVERGDSHPCLFSLNTQFRCREEIAKVFSAAFYGDKLQSSYTPTLSLERKGSLAPISNKPFVIVDTSALSPMGHTVSKSKANLLHAALVRDLRALLTAPGQSSLSDSQLGVIAPYRPQVALLRDLVNEEGGEGVAVGTVHRFQGDERPVIILDLTESTPHRLGSFLGASSLRESGAKLLNVALSRAKEQMIVVADLASLGRSLGPSMILHGIIAWARESGAVVDAAEILGGSELDSSGSRHRIGLYSRALFLSAFIDDLRAASRSATVVSTALNLSLVKVVANVLVTRPSALELSLFVPAYDRDVSPTLDEYETSLELLAQVGAKITFCRKDAHGLVLLDDETAWVGPLRPLACLENETGSMARLGGRAATCAAARFLTPDGVPVLKPSAVGEL